MVLFGHWAQMVMLVNVLPSKNLYVQTDDKSTPLGSLLSSLLGLNCYTSKDGATALWSKSIFFKRFATLTKHFWLYRSMISTLYLSVLWIQLALLPNVY